MALYGIDITKFLGGRSPYDDVVALLTRARHAREIRRLVIIDCPGYAAPEGWYEHFATAMRHGMDDLEVLLLDLDRYPSALLEADEAAATAVYRLFLAEEMPDGGQCFRRIVESGAFVVNTFETYLMGSKCWLWLLFDDRYRSLLDEQELRAVDEYLPYAFEVTSGNLDSALESKDSYVFKEVQSSQGRDVLVGVDHDVAALRDRLSVGGVWCAQEFIPQMSVALPDEALQLQAGYHVVFGMYHTNDWYSGMLLRATTSGKVVNVSAGARAAWCVPYAEAEIGNTRERSPGKTVL